MAHRWSTVTATICLAACLVACGPDAGRSSPQNPDPSTSTYADGVAAYEQEDYEAALPIFRSLAERGDADAQFALGRMLLRGEGIEDRDVEEAERFYRQAAEQGHPDARFQLGRQLLLGMFFEPDYVEAFRWQDLAARQGHAEAQSDLGYMYATAHGVPRDSVRAYMWYTVAIGGLADDRADRARRDREEFVGPLSPEELAEAEALMGQCQEYDFQDC